MSRLKCDEVSLNMTYALYYFYEDNKSYFLPLKYFQTNNDSITIINYFL